MRTLIKIVMFLLFPLCCLSQKDSTIYSCYCSNTGQQVYVKFAFDQTNDSIVTKTIKRDTTSFKKEFGAHSLKYATVIADSALLKKKFHYWKATCIAYIDAKQTGHPTKYTQPFQFIMIPGDLDDIETSFYNKKLCAKILLNKL